jgi:hypothetical protein
MSYLHSWLKSRLLHVHACNTYTWITAPGRQAAYTRTCKARARVHIMRIRACIGCNGTAAQACACSCSHASNIINNVAVRACLSAHAGPIRMGTMPPPPLLPAIQLMVRQPADPQPAPALRGDHSSPT